MRLFSYTNEEGEPRIVKIILHSLLALFLAITLISSVGTVSAGERGILLQFSAITDTTFDEGLYFKLPFIQSVKIVDVRVQKDQVKAGSASKDLQIVESEIALNYHLDPKTVAKLYQEVGIEYKTRIIDPAIQESVKASTAKFTAEELITKRELVRDEVKLLLKTKLVTNGIIVDEFNIIDFDFSKTFNDAIEAKVTAEQSALAAKNKLEQVKFEAQQAIEAAQGKAKAIQIEGEALKQSPQVTELRWIEKWNGQVPQYWGQATPFIGIK